MKNTFCRILCFLVIFILCTPYICFAHKEDIVLQYSDIFNCVVNGIPTAKWEKLEENGKKFLCVEPDIESELYTDISAKKSVSLDSWGLDKYKIDFTKYRYITIEYKYTSEHPIKVVPTLNLLKQKVLSTTVKITADEPVTPGKFTTMTFYIPNISGLVITPDSPYISQLHFFLSVKHM